MNPPLEESFGYIIGHSYNALRNRLHRNFANATINITHDQWIIMIKLWLRDGQNQMQLSQATKKDKASIARLINRLETRNLVVRIPDKSDKRNRLIYLTKKGRDLQEASLKEASKTIELAQQGVSQKELKNCKDVLRKIYRNIEGQNI